MLTVRQTGEHAARAILRPFDDAGRVAFDAVPHGEAASATPIPGAPPAVLVSSLAAAGAARRMRRRVIGAAVGGALVAGALIGISDAPPDGAPLPPPTQAAGPRIGDIESGLTARPLTVTGRTSSQQSPRAAATRRRQARPGPRGPKPAHAAASGGGARAARPARSPRPVPSTEQPPATSGRQPSGSEPARDAHRHPGASPVSAFTSEFTP